MAYMDHPGLCSRISTQNNSGVKLPLTGFAWKAGFDILGFYIPRWILTIIAFFLLVEFCFFDYFLINPEIPRTLSYIGMIHVVASAWEFVSQGSIGWGLVVTGLGYLILSFHFYDGNKKQRAFNHYSWFKKGELNFSTLKKITSSVAYQQISVLFLK